MSHLITNEQKLNEIIFAGRNKAYGAYVLRSDYGNTVFKSISFMIIGVGSVLSFAFFMTNRNDPGPDLSGQIPIDSIYTVKFDMEEEKSDPAEAKKEKQAPANDPEPAENASVTVSDSVVVERASTFTASVASLNTSSLGSGVDPGSEGSTGSGSTSVLGSGKENEVKSTYEVDSEPLFEGGLNALYRFVSSHLKYPNLASAEGKEGTVYVKFVVDENGQVGKLSLLNSVGYGMDDEALRVVSMIPKFKSPAKVKGTPVKVYYQMPIRFRFR